MPWLTTAPILIWAALSILALAFLWYIHPGSRLNQILAWLVYTSVNFYFFLAVNWTAVNFYLRILPLAVSFILLLRWLRPLRNSPWLPPRQAGSIALSLVLLVLLGLTGYVNYRVLQSRSLRNVAHVPLLSLYPVRTGMYVVINGGNGEDGWALNGYTRDWLGRPKEGNETLAFAMDFIEIRTSGAAAEGILSRDFTTYEIFNELVYSPCIGEVISVEDGHPDVEPLSPGAGLGNQIVIQCSDFVVTLANLRNGSINATVGEQLTFNRQIAQVGNSADRSVPHLHMHVTNLEGEAVPILFEAAIRFRFVARNHLYIR